MSDDLSDLPPGPWRYRPDPMDDWGYVRDANGDIVADCCSSKLASEFRERMDIRRTSEGFPPDYNWCADNHAGPPQARAVADLLIRARAESDETPIDEDWLLSIGFVRREHDDAILDLADRLISFMSWHGNMVWRVDGGSVPKVMQPRTRGHLRALANRLGVPLSDGGGEWV